MINIVTTYNIDNASNRESFVKEFEQVLIDLNQIKQSTNQSTYFGSFETSYDYVKDVYNAVRRMDWHIDDEVTIYYPKFKYIDNKPSSTIEQFRLKTSGAKDLIRPQPSEI